MTPLRRDNAEEEEKAGFEALTGVTAGKDDSLIAFADGFEEGDLLVYQSD